VQGVALLELVHGVLGFTKSAFLPLLIQIGGRFFYTFVLIPPYKELQMEPAVFCVMLAWSLGELIRYPFYVLNELGINSPLFTWLRYSGFLIFYPCGMLCEWYIAYKALSLLQPSPLYYFTFLWTVLFPIGGVLLLSNMLGQRRKKLAETKGANKTD